MNFYYKFYLEVAMLHLNNIVATTMTTFNNLKLDNLKLCRSLVASHGISECRHWTEALDNVESGPTQVCIAQ